MATPLPVEHENDEAVVADATQHAVAFHQRGMLAEAEKLYASILQVRPDHFDALHLLGVLRQQQGNSTEGMRLIGAALKMNPQSVDALCNFGAVLNALKRHDEALAAFDQALAIKPDIPATLNYRGNTLVQLNRFEEALAAFGRTLAVTPNDIEALISCGNALVMFNLPEQALTPFDRVLQIQPDHAVALGNRGLALTQLKRYDDALACYRKALDVAPDRVAALNSYGNALLMLGRTEEALATCDEALAIAPDQPDALKQRIAALQALGRHDEALDGCDRVLAVTPDDPSTNFNRGFSLATLGRLEEAIESYEKARAFDHMPARNMLGICRLATADWAQADKIAGEVRADLASGKPGNPLLATAYGFDAAAQLKAARSYLRILVPVLPNPFVHSNAMRADKLRIAYVTTAFREHPIATAIAGLLESHDRERFEIIGISLGPSDTSGIRARMIGALDQFHDVASESDRNIAKLLNDLQVHIAIDLNGWTDGCRPGIFAYRPAPIQVSYLGYAGTTGAEFIDYVLADETALPFDQNPFFAEKIVHLPDCYHVNDASRQIPSELPSRSDLGLPDQGLVFCCFNHSGKITAPIFDIWMRLLARVPGSVLWLSKINKHAEANLRREAAARGVDPGRLIIAPWTDSIEDHLARHRAADLFLDTLPYNAHSTASDALFAGLPVVTCAGTTFAGRVGASLLKAAGLPELVTNSLEDYEALALNLATDRAALSKVRRRLEENRRTCPLFDGDRFRHGIETAYATMWDIYRRGEKPRSFRLKPSVGAKFEIELTSIEIGEPPFVLGNFSAALAMLFNMGLRYSTAIDVGCADGTFFLQHQQFGIFDGATPVNIEANPLYEESLRAIKDCAGGHYIIGAASDADGEAEMTLGAHPYWSSLRDKDDLYWKQIHNLSQGSSKVRTFTIDGLAEQLSLKPPYLLKLDVQGAEAQVLRGARRVLEQTDVVICEADLSDFQSLNGLLVEAGFDLFDLTHLQRIEGGALGWFYPVYLNRRRDSIKASTLWDSSHSDQIVQQQVERRASLLRVNAQILAEMRRRRSQQA